MPTRTLAVDVMPQPDDLSCGPTCLHAVYRYYGDEIALEDVIRQAPTLEQGGTLAVLLGSHALRRGYGARVYSFNLTLLDPSWFSEGKPAVDVSAKLEEQGKLRNDVRGEVGSRSYAEFLRLGGELLMEDVSAELLHGCIDRGRPILVGVSATYLYGSPRELPNGDYDDLRGAPQGHFIVLTGYRDGEVRVADPWQGAVHGNRYPVATDSPSGRHYWVSMRRLVHAILLGVLTYDGNLLVIEPPAAVPGTATRQ